MAPHLARETKDASPDYVGDDGNCVHPRGAARPICVTAYGADDAGPLARSL
jgi:hypothetical protein